MPSCDGSNCGACACNCDSYFSNKSVELLCENASLIHENDSLRGRLKILLDAIKKELNGEELTEEDKNKIKIVLEVSERKKDV